MITYIGCGVIWFEYKGDEICWDGKKYISLLSERTFSSLEEMDEFWEDYAKANQRQEVTITREMALDAGDPSLEGQTWQW